MLSHSGANFSRNNVRRHHCENWGIATDLCVSIVEVFRALSWRPYDRIDRGRTTTLRIVTPHLGKLLGVQGHLEMYNNFSCTKLGG